MNWVLTLGLTLVCSIAAIEFGADLEARPFLLNLVVALDLVLVTGFAIYVLQVLSKSESAIHVALREHRVDVAILLASVLLCATAPRMSATLIGTRLILESLSLLINSRFGRTLFARLNPHPSQTVALSFIGMIGVSSIFLMLPAATTDGLGTSFTDAVFTTTSATTVTGLVVHDDASRALNKKDSSLPAWALCSTCTQRLDSKNSSLRSQARPLSSKLWRPWSFSHFGRLADTITGAAWWSIFYSVSAFCHAGFVLTPDSLTVWAEDFWISNIFALLITVAQLGFPVIADLWFSRSWRVLKTPTKIWRSLHVQTRIVLVMTLVLNALGMLAFLFFEFNGSLSGLSLFGKVNAAFFQSVSMRSAGFNTVDLLTASQPLPMDKVLFEAFSAFGTVGLSMGITDQFDDLGRWMLTILMYIGRVGPLTMALAIGRRFRPRAYRYPDCDLAVG